MRGVNLFTTCFLLLIIFIHISLAQQTSPSTLPVVAPKPSITQNIGQKLGISAGKQVKLVETVTKAARAGKKITVVISKGGKVIFNRILPPLAIIGELVYIADANITTDKDGNLILHYDLSAGETGLVIGSIIAEFLFPPLLIAELLVDLEMIYGKGYQNVPEIKKIVDEIERYQPQFNQLFNCIKHDRDGCVIKDFDGKYYLVPKDKMPETYLNMYDYVSNLKFRLEISKKNTPSVIDAKRSFIDLARAWFKGADFKWERVNRDARQRLERRIKE